MISRNEAATAARTASDLADQAADDADHTQIIADLLTHPGLAYASPSGSFAEPYLVAYKGRILGEARTTTPGVLGHWYARPANSDTTQGDGPFPTVRAAAASLLRIALTESAEGDDTPGKVRGNASESRHSP